MKYKITKGLWFFLLFFAIGLGGYLLVSPHLTDSKPIVTDEENLMPVGRISDVATQVSPSVVGITNLQRDLEYFNQKSTESSGSGVILDNSGYIVTNNHVVRDANKIIVTLADGNEEEAKVIGTDSRTDLAVIKIKVDNYVTPVKFGDSDELLVGEEVVAIGNPLGLRFARSVTAGVVSGLNRILTTEEGFAFRLIQTDAAINPGNSGGALVNLRGELIGINTIKIAAEGFEGMGFSIPSNQVKLVVESIKENGKVIRPIMGIRIIREFTCDETEFFSLPRECGVAVDIIRGGPAYKAGLKKYDIITKIDGIEVETALLLQEEIGLRKIGDAIHVEYIRIPANKEGQPEIKTSHVILGK
ncbi:MAG TPA: trypsin-like peptidase domain-containing protein [Syntrophomonadaceae bacterium]|nr:trypsin-like peptidase domain-containing protein [Syntrophomonadaceae bacterium]